MNLRRRGVAAVGLGAASHLDDRAHLGKGTPFAAPVRHELAYAARWCATSLVFTGVGVVLYRLMLLVGIVEP